MSCNGKRCFRKTLRFTNRKWKEILSVDENIAIRAASLKHGLAIPFIDALIMAMFLEAGCKEIHIITDCQRAYRIPKIIQVSKLSQPEVEG